MQQSFPPYTCIIHYTQNYLRRTTCLGKAAALPHPLFLPSPPPPPSLSSSLSVVFIAILAIALGTVAVLIILILYCIVLKGHNHNSCFNKVYLMHVGLHYKRRDLVTIYMQNFIFSPYCQDVHSSAGINRNGEKHIWEFPLRPW